MKFDELYRLTTRLMSQARAVQNLLGVQETKPDDVALQAQIDEQQAQFVDIANSLGQVLNSAEPRLERSAAAVKRAVQKEVSIRRRK